MRIRDMSEVLPKARELDKPGYLGTQAKLLSLDLDDDEERLARDGELGFVEEDAVVEASKIDCERSGIKWNIKNHQKQKQALRTPGSARKVEAIKAEVVTEVKAEGASESDMSPPRNNASSRQAARGDLSPPRARTEDKARADLSPPRRPAAAKTMARKPMQNGSDDDLSPPRQVAAPSATRKRHDSDEDLSPPRAPAAAAAKLRHDSDDDLSPPRGAAPQQEVKKEADSDGDLSPPRPNSGSQRARHDSDADLSPPRKKEVPKRTRHASDSDLSPARKEVPMKDVKQEAPKRTRHDSDSDLSPPRTSTVAPKRERHDSDADMSPPRRSGNARHDSDADMSPPRKGKDDDADLMSSGLRAGLVSGLKLREEAAKVREERKAALAAAPDHETGKNADTVYRSRAGGTIDREAWVQEQQKKKKKRMSEYPEQELAWGGGLKQASTKDEEMEEATRISQQPFARFEPDARAVQEMEDRKSWNDPMSKFSDGPGDDEFAAVPASSSAPAPAPAPAVNKPKCPHAPWPNRFGILPGYRWDGKVRGSGYEKRWIQAKNDREFTKTEKYRWERLED